MTIRPLIAIAASLFLGACGGDGDGGEGPYMCVGSYASLTNEQFASMAGTGMCANSADLAVACDVDLSSLVGVCGVTCYSMNTMQSQEELAACTATCVKNNPGTVVDPSDACLGCYLQSVGCTLQFCQTQCAGGASTTPCIECRATNNCTSAFFTCSGLPLPPSDGG